MLIMTKPNLLRSRDGKLRSCEFKILKTIISNSQSAGLPGKGSPAFFMAATQQSTIHKRTDCLEMASGVIRTSLKRR
jgi:hypothetical protein